jgi:hypothetical protein
MKGDFMSYAVNNKNENRVKELMDRSGGESSEEDTDEDIYGKSFMSSKSSDSSIEENEEEEKEEDDEPINLITTKITEA